MFSILKLYLKMKRGHTSGDVISVAAVHLPGILNVIQGQVKA